MTEIMNRAPRMVSIKEAAQETGLSKYEIRKGIKAGLIPYSKFTRTYKINLDLLIDQMNGKKV